MAEERRRGGDRRTTDTVTIPADEIEAMLRDFRGFLDDPIALIRRAVFVLEQERKRARLAIVPLFVDWRSAAASIGAGYFASNGNDQWAWWLQAHIPVIGETLRHAAQFLLP